MCVTNEVEIPRPTSLGDLQSLSVVIRLINVFLCLIQQVIHDHKAMGLSGQLRASVTSNVLFTFCTDEWKFRY